MDRNSWFSQEPLSAKLSTLVRHIHDGPQTGVDFVGGIFNGYEKALHYEIVCALSRMGISNISQEYPVGRPNRRCDLVFPAPPSGESDVWLEIKMWWFLRKGGYWMQKKCMNGPATDWEKIKHCDAANAKKAIMLVCVWDCDEGRQEALDWLLAIDQTLTSAVELQGGTRHALKLRAHDFGPVEREQRPAYRAEGQVVVWATG